MRKTKILALLMGVSMVLTATFAMPVSAVDLNAVGGSSSNTGTAQEQSSDYITEDTFKTLYGDTTISQEEAQKAAELAAPAVKLIRSVMSIMLAILPALMLLNCILDITCLTISPLRKAMMAVHGAGGGAAAGGFGGGGFGGGGFGGGGFGAPAPAGGGGEPQGIMQMIAQWTSKEAVDAVNECQPAGGAAGGGGFGGGGFGGGGFGAPAPAAAPKAKLLLVTYFKKKAIFLVVFGVCVIVFSCTAFTDLGLKIGAWIVNKVAGVDF